jgi:hypothetical protein
LRDEQRRLREEELRLCNATEPSWAYHSDDAD